MSKYFSKDKWSYMFRILNHPADSFYEIRHRNFGSVPLALLVVFAFGLCYTLNRILASFVVNDADPSDIDGIAEMASIFILMLLFAVGNWSVTCLMSGEGRFKDILTITGYAFMPMIFTLIPATLLSQVIASGEEVFYQVIVGLGIAWTAVLILIGVMTIHNYSLGKTLATLVITVLAMLVIVFLVLLLFTLVDQVIGFFVGIYTELIFRG
ncbi:hypothetical protein FACS1894217_02890 [Clostridia bacterium]|nr:hypothetical protein FACS1894217_02890 [Clostridia bacterium]